MFKKNAPRYASYGVIDNVPGNLIDTIWYIIDRNLYGMIELGPLISFDIEQQDADKNSLALFFHQEDSDLKIKFDIPLPFRENLPAELIVYDDGLNQTVMLPSEVK